MSQRLSVDGHGRLVNRNGEVVGRIASLTIELDSSGGKGGIRLEPSSRVALSSNAEESQALALSSNVQETLLPDGGVGEATDEAKVWAHYQRVIPSGSLYQLDNKRKAIIRNALKVRPLAQVLRAIDGLAVSPHHNGQNDRRKKYLGIRYALQGIGGESNDERIDKMAEIASSAESGLLAGIPSAGHAMVRERQRQVEDMLLNPGDRTRRERAGDSESYLRDVFGLTAKVEDGGVVAWSRA